MYHTIWAVGRKSALPIINVKGMGEQRWQEKYMIAHAVMLIEKAETFRGRLLSEEPTEPTNSKIEVQFNVMFPNETELSNFVQFIQSKPGLM